MTYPELGVSTLDDFWVLHDSVERFLWAGPPDGPSTTVLRDVLEYLEVVLTTELGLDTLQSIVQDIELETFGLRFLRP